MQIKVTLSGMVAKEYSNGERKLEVEIKEESTIKNVFKKIGVPFEERSFIMYTVNGDFLKEDKKLKDRDIVKIFQVFGGG